jgi:hypothetical protein
VIKGTIVCVSYHDEATPFTVSLKQSQLTEGVSVLTYLCDYCHIQPYPSRSIITSDFVVGCTTLSAEIPWQKDVFLSSLSVVKPAASA